MAEHPTTQYVDADLTRGELRVLSELSEAAGAALFAQAQAVVAAKVPAVVVDLAAVPRMDSLGGAWLTRTAEIFRQAGVPWQTALWFTGANGRLDGARPVDLLDTEPAEVARVARDEAAEIIG